MVFGKAMAIASCIVYIMLEVASVDARYSIFLLFELMLGISMGKRRWRAAGAACIAMTSF